MNDWTISLLIAIVCIFIPALISYLVLNKKPKKDNRYGDKLSE